MKKTAILSILLCLCMVLGLALSGVSAFAADLIVDDLPKPEDPTENAPVTDTEPEKPDTLAGSIKVTITDNNSWNDLATITAPEDGVYTFIISAGMGAWDKASCDNNSKAPDVDPNQEEDRKGGSFSVTLKKGETYEFYVMNPEKGVEVEIAWTMAAAEIPAEPQNTTAVLGENSIVVPEGVQYVEYTFVVEKAGDYTFASNDLRVQVVNEMGMPQMGSFLQPGTYTLMCGPKIPAAGTYILNISVVYPKTAVQIGDNFITIEEGAEGTEVEFVVEKAGNYTFSGDVGVQIWKDGMMVGKGMASLEPGTYTLRCFALNGAGAGTWRLKIETDAYDAPKLEVGDNAIEITDAENGAQYTFTPTEDGNYVFSGIAENAYVIVLIKDADNNMVGMSEAPLTADTTYNIFVRVADDDANGVAGNFTLNVGKKVEPQGELIEELPFTITGAATDDLVFSYIVTEDCIIEIIIVAGNPLIALPNTDASLVEELENGKRIPVKAGEILIINPFKSTEAFEVSVSVFDVETLPGGSKNPETMDNTQNGTQALNFPASEGYHFGWTAAKDGKVTFTLNELETMEGKEILVNGTALTLDGKTITIDVSAGDTISVVCKSAAEGTILLDVNFEEKTAEPEPTEPTQKPTQAPTQAPTQTPSGGTAEPKSPVVTIVVIVVIVVAVAVVAVVVLKKKK